MNRQTLSLEQRALRMTYPGFVFRALCKEGHEPGRLLANTGLTEEVLSDPDFQTGLAPLRLFFLNAIELTGEPHLGIRLAQRFEASFIGLPAYAAMNAATFHDALNVLSRFFHLAFPAIEFTFPDPEADVQPGEFAVRLRSKVPLGDISYFACSSALVGCDRLCREILRISKAGLRGEMSVRKPEGWPEVEGQIGFPIQFEAPDIRLFLSSSLLTRPLPGEDPLNHPRLLALCEQLAEQAQNQTTPLGKILLFLQEGQNVALPISAVAAALGYSERGLRRYLERSGTTFRTLTNDILERRACSLLSNPDLPIKTIAHDLGFDTPSNFAKSFKRWTGSSPSDFRLALNAKRVSGQK